MPSKSQNIKMTIEWRSVEISVFSNKKASKKKRISILSGMSGKIESGLVGIIGPSGSGKTTFLKMLSGQVPKKSVTSGLVHYNGKERKIEDWLDRMVYVEQNYVVYNFLSAKEHVSYSAKLSNASTKNLDEDITKLFEKLGMKDIMHKTMRVLSNGQRKRVLIIMELMKKPDIIILDEPTSGLDNTNAYYMVDFLKKITKEKKIVICSIHQPDERTIRLFDTIMLLNNGQSVFFGKKRECEQLLEKNGLLKRTNISFSTHIMEIFWSKKTEYNEVVHSFPQPDKIFENNTSEQQSAEKYKFNEKNKDDFYINMRFSPRHVYILIRRLLKCRFSSKVMLIHIFLFYTPLIFLFFITKYFILFDLIELGSTDRQNNLAKYHYLTENIFNKFDDFFSRTLFSIISLLCSSMFYLNISDTPKTRHEIGTNRYSIFSYHVCCLLDGVIMFFPAITLCVLCMNCFISKIFDITFIMCLFLHYLCIYPYLYCLLAIFDNFVWKCFVLLVFSSIESNISSLINRTSGTMCHSALHTIFSCFVYVFAPSSLYENFIMRILYKNMIRVWFGAYPKNTETILFCETKTQHYTKRESIPEITITLRIFLTLVSLLFYAVIGALTQYKNLKPRFRLLLSNPSK